MTTVKGPDAQNAPVVDEERIQETYAELKELQVLLDSNPIDYGPRRFNSRIAQVRAMLNRVEQLALQASEDLHYFKRLINPRRDLYNLEKRELMVKDPSCRVGRSQGEREALADIRLRTQIEEIQEYETSVYDIETLMASIRSKRTELKDAQSRMRDQMKMIEHDIAMGGRWGNREPSPGVVSPLVSSSSDDLDNMIADVDTTLGWAGDDVPPLLLPPEEEEEEEEDDPPVLPFRSVLSKSPVEEPVVILGVPPIEEAFTSGLDIAFAASKDASVSFGDGELTEAQEVEDFLTVFSEVQETSEPSILRTTSSSGEIDDLIASLSND